MGRQNGDAKVATSSIALLQERFRELQKIREKRQEKQLLKLFSSQSQSETSTTTSTNSAMQLPNDHQDSLLCLGLNSQTNNHYVAPSSSTLWPNSATSSSSSRTHFENSDVDTSLHL